MIIKNLGQAGLVIKPPLSKKIKSGLVVLRKDEEIGEHTTKDSEEVIIILEGEATIFIEDEFKRVEKNSAIFIPKNKRHNIRNDLKREVKYVYVVTSI